MSDNLTRRSGRRWFSAAVIALGLLIFITLLNRVNAVEDPEIRVPLRTADVVLHPGVYDVGGSRYAVIKLERNLRKAEIDALSAQGLRLLSYLGDGAFIAGIDPGALSAEVSQAYGIDAATAWTAENKATPAVRQGIVPEHAQTSESMLKLAVVFFDDVNAQTMEAILARHASAYTLQIPPDNWHVEIEASRVDGLLHEEGIYLVETVVPITEELDDTRKLLHVDEVQKAVFVDDKIRYDGLSGKGILLQVSEEVYDDHPDFKDFDGKKRIYNPQPNNSIIPHGTYVAGMMAGGGRLSPNLYGTDFNAPLGTWRGVAPEATLYEGIYDGSKGKLIDAGNYSRFWFETMYSSSFQAADANIRGDNGIEFQFPTSFAGGNHQFEVQGQDGYYSIYSPTKNGIVVGGVNANDGILWSGKGSIGSSLGPTLDGRIKPDVMAPASANHVPRQHDLFNDPITMIIDYIRIMDAKTGAYVEGWEFNKAGDREGWFDGSGRLKKMEVAGGYLTLEFIGPDHKIRNDAIDLFAAYDQTIVIKYQLTTPSGPLGGHSGFAWYKKDPKDLRCWLSTRTEAHDGWVVGTFYVGRYGEAAKDEYDAQFNLKDGSWRGEIVALEFTPYWEDYGIMTTHWDKRAAKAGDRPRYIFGPGTSIAAPAVTGGVALMLQQFRDVHHINLQTNPPYPSTHKAILIHTAEDLVREAGDPRDPNNTDTGVPVVYYEGPDYATGYGLVNVKAAVDFIAADPGPGQERRLIHEGQLDAYEENVYELLLSAEDIAGMGDELKFTLVWDDYPGDVTVPQTAPKLVNDLDLVLIDPTGAAHLPWTLDPLPLASCGGNGTGCNDPDPIAPSDVKPAYKDSDHLNNVEMVQTEALIPGRWLVIVSAYNMPMPLQSYSLVGSAPTRFVQEGKWVDMGSITDHDQALDPALALGQNDAPFIAWSDYSGSDEEIYIKEWKNSAWKQKGRGSASGSGISSSNNDSMLVALTVDDQGSPIVAWEERKDHSSEIYAKRWNGSSWEGMGGSVSGDSGSAFPGAATRPTIAYSEELGPIVAWHNYHTWKENGETKGAYAIYVKRWNGSAWVEIGPDSASGIGINRDYVNAFTPSLAVQNKDIYIAWANEIAGGNSEIYIKRWNGYQWVEMGDSAHFGGVSKTTGSDSWRPSLAIDPYTWQPVVAWEDNARGNYDIYLKKWNGSAWVEMGGSVSGGGISKTETDSKWPSLAIGSNGLPIAVWQENRSKDVEVYGKQWNGDAWVEIGGSVFGGGISGCGAFTSKPSLAVDAAGAPMVAFHCGIAGDYDVHVRRWQVGGGGGGLPKPPAPTATPPSVTVTPTATATPIPKGTPAAPIARNFVPAVEVVPGLNWKAGMQIQNAGSSRTPITLTAYYPSGQAQPCGAKETDAGASANFLSYIECGRSHPPLSSATADGGGQPLRSIVTLSNSNPDGSGYAGASYTAMGDAKTSERLFFPLFKHNYNGRTTTFSIQNAGDTSTTITAVFRLGTDEWDKAYTVPPFASALVSPADAGVPEGRYGSLTITGANKIAGTSLEHEHDAVQAVNLQASSAFTESDFDSTLFCPLFRNNHTSKGITSGVQVQNASSATQTVKFTFTPVGGGAKVMRTNSVVPGASINFYGPTTAGVPDGTYGSVTLESGGDITAVVSERGELPDKRVLQTTYACFAKRNTTSTILIPLYKEFYKGNTTGISIQNVSGDGSEATVTLEYRKTGPFAAAGESSWQAPAGSFLSVIFTHKTAIPDGAGITFWGVSNLLSPADIIAGSGKPESLMGSYGSVVITSDQPVVALVNEATDGSGIAQDSKNYEGFNED